MRGNLGTKVAGTEVVGTIVMLWNKKYKMEQKEKQLCSVDESGKTQQL